MTQPDLSTPPPLRLAARDKIAVSLKEATQLVPFSITYLKAAMHRIGPNHLPARQTPGGGKYFILMDDLVEWVRNEGDPT